LKLRSITKCADMKMRFVRAFAFAGQRRPASGTKSPPPAGRRIEFRDLTLSNDVRVAFERHKDGDGRTAMLPATFAVAPRYRFRLSGGHEAYGAAQAAAFELIAHARNLALRSWRCTEIRSSGNPSSSGWLAEASVSPVRFEPAPAATIGDRPPSKGNVSPHVYR
jgi:hypothetical protein